MPLRALSRRRRACRATLLLGHAAHADAADAAWLDAAKAAQPAVIESLKHARDEYIEIDSIVPRLYLMTRMLQVAARP